MWYVQLEDKNKKEINGTLCFRISIDTLVNLTSSKILTIGTPKIFCFIHIEEGYVAIETYSFLIKFISIEVHRKCITFQQPLIENTNRENESMKNLHRICFRPQWIYGDIGREHHLCQSDAKSIWVHRNA
jgi:hypothetical protein